MATTPATLKEAGLLTPHEAAQRLDICERTLRRLVREGQIAEPIRRNRRWVRYRDSDISAYIARLVRSGK